MLIYVVRVKYGAMTIDRTTLHRTTTDQTTVDQNDA